MKTKEQSLSEIVSAVTGTTYGRDTEEAHIQRIASALSNVTKDSGKSIIEMLSPESIEYATDEEIDALFDEGGGGGSSSSSGSSGSTPSPSGEMTPEKFSVLVQNALDNGAVITLLPGDEIYAGSIDYGNIPPTQSGWQNYGFIDDGYRGYALYYNSSLVGLVLEDDSAPDGVILYAADSNRNLVEGHSVFLSLYQYEFRLFSDSAFANVPMFAANGLGSYFVININESDNSTFYFAS